MAKLKILTEPDPRYGTVSDRLRRKSAKIEVIDDGLRALARDMHETLHDASGVGLAAPQVGILRRLVVIYLPPDYDEDGDPEVSLTLINPEILKAGGRDFGPEGCLSFPDLYGDVQRYAWVNMRARDLDCNELRIKARGLLARCIQHEIYHLDGVLFFDRMDDWSSLRYPSPAPEPDEPALEPATARSRAD